MTSRRLFAVSHPTVVTLAMATISALIHPGCEKQPGRQTTDRMEAPPAVVAPSMEIPEVTKRLDARLAGKWKVIGSVVDSMEFRDSGEFKNKLHNPWLGKDSIEGAARMLTSTEKPVLELTTGGDNPSEVQTFEADFVDGRLLVLRNVIYPPRNSPGVTVKAFGGQVLARLNADGEVEKEVLARGVALSNQLFPQPPAE